MTGLILATTDTSLSYGFIDMLGGLTGSLISAFLGFIYAMLGGALAIGFTSGSFGKWLMGVRVVDASYRPIGVPRALSREILVWVNGLGIGIPFVTLVTLVMAYRRLDGDAITSWDDKLGLVVLHRPRGAVQTVLGSIGIVLYVAALVALRWPTPGPVAPSSAGQPPTMPKGRQPRLRQRPPATACLPSARPWARLPMRFGFVVFSTCTRLDRQYWTRHRLWLVATYGRHIW